MTVFPEHVLAHCPLLLNSYGVQSRMGITAHDCSRLDHAPTGITHPVQMWPPVGLYAEPTTILVSCVKLK